MVNSMVDCWAVEKADRRELKMELMKVDRTVLNLVDRLGAWTVLLWVGLKAFQLEWKLVVRTVDHLVEKMEIL